MLMASSSHLTSSKACWIIAVSVRQTAQLAVVIARSMSQPTASVVVDMDGDRQAKLDEYCNWGLTQVGSDRWRNALQAANQVAMEQFLELNTILQHPKVVADLMVKHRVQPGIALQFVSNIKKFLREVKGS